MEIKPSDIPRFWAKVDKRGADECWPWIGAKSTCNKQYTPMTYGAFKQRRAHRASWIIANGRQPQPGYVICHSCDNPLCVNPAHLFEGTRADNQRDMQRKLRSGILGEKNPKAKLTPEQVLEIRASTESDKALADRFGVWQSTIYAIRTGKKWRNLPGAKKRGPRPRRLSPEQVRDLRRRHRAGEMTTELAKAFGISQGYVSQVALGQCYRSVGE
jgi:transposase